MLRKQYAVTLKDHKEQNLVKPNKGKGIDPKNWDNLNLNSEEENV